MRHLAQLVLLTLVATTVMCQQPSGTQQQQGQTGTQQQGQTGTQQQGQSGTQQQGQSGTQQQQGQSGTQQQGQQGTQQQGQQGTQQQGQQGTQQQGQQGTQQQGQQGGATQGPGQQAGGQNDNTYNDVSLEKQKQCFTKPDFQAFVTKVNTTCSAAITGLNVSDAAKMQAFCGGDCIALLKAELPKYDDCLGKQNAEYWRDFRLAMCNQEDGEYCGAKRERLFEPMTCKSYSNQDLCSRAKNCAWTGSECAWRWPADKPGYLPCDKKSCAWKMLAAEIGPQPRRIQDQINDAVRTLQQTYCFRQGDAYCYPKVQKYILTNATFADPAKSDPAQIHSVCNETDTNRRCLFGIFSASFGAMRVQVDNLYRDCVREAQKSAQNNQTRVMQLASLCALSFYSVSQQLNKADALIGGYCVTNTQKKEGENCLTQVRELSREPPAGSCLARAIGNATCNATCEPELANLTKRIGCCGYFISQLTNAKPSPLPPIPGLNLRYEDLFAPGTLQALQKSPFEFLRTCQQLNNSQTVNDLSTKCRGVLPGQQPPRKKMNLGIAWNTLKANDTLKSIMETSLQSDIAQQAGISQDCIQNGTLSEDSSRSITVNSSAHGMHSLADSTSTATTYNYALEGATPEETEAASSAVDSKTSSGDLTLGTTSSSVSSCSNCTSTSTTSSNPFSFLTASAASPVSVAVLTAALVAAVMLA